MWVRIKLTLCYVSSDFVRICNYGCVISRWINVFTIWRHTKNYWPAAAHIDELNVTFTLISVTRKACITSACEWSVRVCTCSMVVTSIGAYFALINIWNIGVFFYISYSKKIIGFNFASNVNVKFPGWYSSVSCYILNQMTVIQKYQIINMELHESYIFNINVSHMWF